MDTNHTILLIQASAAADTRTWSDYNSTELCLEAVCKIYEEHLKKVRQKLTVTYDVDDLFEFLNRLTDLSCMVLDTRRNVYIPRSREWIKAQLFNLLSKNHNF
ncbi:unnamed protein product [Bursaphelenchus okinawaensis]|uniref:Enhancer of rudimentary homolog n=1 Tax=Bursaphelenchus okinawaensis TaxID=465554 RepID=A0A811KW18_9BILA|nr:unnamed protein product [Bursaphelenchus okinawaensis]CAG9112724.1 unnamed protein product [Bursaphelenchus okinawaensis]